MLHFAHRVIFFVIDKRIEETLFFKLKKTKKPAISQKFRYFALYFRGKYFLTMNKQIHTE
jgi:hypothetical protein